MRIVFLGSPPFATSVLARLVESPFKPGLVITPPERPAGRGRMVEASEIAELARDGGIELAQPESVRDPEFLSRLRALAPDVLFVVAYGEILRAELLDLAHVTALNVHPSLLPRWRGATPIQSAVLAGDPVTGVSIQRIVRELDAGDLLLQKELEILPGETAGELAARLSKLSGEAALEALELVASGRATYRPQDPTRVTLCRKLEKEHGEVDWRKSAVELERHVRAMNPWPIARTKLPRGGALAIWRASLAPLAAQEPHGKPGELLATGARLLVACGAGVVELVEVQAQGKRPMSASDFLRGARLAVGDVLGSP